MAFLLDFRATPGLSITTSLTRIMPSSVTTREMLGIPSKMNRTNPINPFSQHIIDQRGLLTIVAWKDSYKAMIVTRPLLVQYVMNKYICKFCSMY